MQCWPDEQVVCSRIDHRSVYTKPGVAAHTFKGGTRKEMEGLAAPARCTCRLPDGGTVYKIIFQITNNELMHKIFFVSRNLVREVMFSTYFRGVSSTQLRARRKSEKSEGQMSA
jgi:hypothetical protein